MILAVVRVNGTLRVQECADKAAAEAKVNALIEEIRKLGYKNAAFRVKYYRSTLDEAVTITYQDGERSVKAGA